MQEQAEDPIILFDGVCNLCQGSVRFIIRNDPGAVFRFASLQSEAARRVMRDRSEFAVRGIVDSVVLLEGGSVYTHSTAVLHICRRLSGFWPLLYGFIVVPRPLRDVVYKWVARNRYHWFGKKEACLMPTPDIQARFLE